MNQQANFQRSGPPASSSYFARHWRGELSLPKSYWLNGALLFGVGCNVIFGVITTLAAVLLPPALGV
jgi:hypothetical protein